MNIVHWYGRLKAQRPIRRLFRIENYFLDRRQVYLKTYHTSPSDTKPTHLHFDAIQQSFYHIKIGAFDHFSID